jgi:NO-binding membrane sensor protein with MHYT domain
VKAFLLTGLALFIVLGLYPLVVFYGLLKKLKWSWFAAFVLGGALIIWIVVEIIMIGYQPQPPLQLIYGIIGLMILFAALLPSVRKFLKS